jgi:hypothetical protein
VKQDIHGRSTLTTGSINGAKSVTMGGFRFSVSRLRPVIHAAFTNAVSFPGGQTYKSLIICLIGQSHSLEYHCCHLSTPPFHTVTDVVVPEIDNAVGAGGGSEECVGLRVVCGMDQVLPSTHVAVPGSNSVHPPIPQVYHRLSCL